MLMGLLGHLADSVIMVSEVTELWKFHKSFFC